MASEPVLAEEKRGLAGYPATEPLATARDMYADDADGELMSPDEEDGGSALYRLLIVEIEQEAGGGEP